MNDSKAVVKKPIRMIKFRIDVEISTPPPVETTIPGESLKIYAVPILLPGGSLESVAKVRVRKPPIRFPNRCVYCSTPSNTTHDVPIQKGKTQNIGSDNRLGNVWVEFKDTYAVPFCREHLNTFRQKSLLNNFVFVPGFILFALLGYLFNPWNPNEDLAGLVFTLVVGGIGSVLIASVLIRYLERVSERFRALRHWPWFTIDVDEEIKFLSFRFYNNIFENEFVEINQGWNPVFE